MRSPCPLTTLPVAIFHAIVSQLRTEDRLLLRGVSRFFNESIKRPTHDDLLAIELEQWAIDYDFFACRACVRLRHRDQFGYRVVLEGDWNFSGQLALLRGGENARKRFCDDCGTTPDLAGECLYPLGAHFLFDDDWWGEEEWVHCKQCKGIPRPPKNIYVGFCETCYKKQIWPAKEYFNSALRRIPNWVWKEKHWSGSPLITTLPPELILWIGDYLRSDELLLLRTVSRFFYNAIPAPTHQQLLATEQERVVATRDYCTTALQPLPNWVWKVKQWFGSPLLTTLPPELIVRIGENLRLDELMLLRTVSRFFHDSIPPPTHQQLLAAEQEYWARANNLLTCGGCLRLRSESKFNYKFILSWIDDVEVFYPGYLLGEAKADQRFCNECGQRELPGDFRYWLGAHYYDEEGTRGALVRCRMCEQDRKAPNDVKIEVGLCIACYGWQELETIQSLALDD